MAKSCSPAKPAAKAAPKPVMKSIPGNIFASAKPAPKAPMKTKKA